MPLILLVYEISAPVLKKANQLWATDSIQSRGRLYLPVDECAVKPKQCSRPPGVKDPSRSNGCNRFDVQHRVKGRGENGEWPPRLHHQHTYAQNDDECEADSEEWVMIPGVGPVQIIALPAHKLSYFPVTKREWTTFPSTFESQVTADKMSRDSMDSVVSRSSIGSLVEDGVGWMVRFLHDSQGKKWAKIGKDLIELI